MQEDRSREGSSPVEAVIFDAGNTLVFLDAVHVEKAFRGTGIRFELARFRSAERRARGDLTGRVRDGHLGTEPHLWRDYFDNLLRGSGVPDHLMDAVVAEIRALHQARHLWTYASPRTRVALERLQDAGLRMAVISNADGRMEDAISRAGIRGFFEFVVDSELVDLAKPDPAIFEVAMDRLDLPPDACVYVGDLFPVDVVGAWAAGMRAVLLDPFQRATERPVARIPDISALPDLLLANGKKGAGGEWSQRAG